MCECVNVCNVCNVCDVCNVCMCVSMRLCTYVLACMLLTVARACGRKPRIGALGRTSMPRACRGERPLAQSLAPVCVLECELCVRVGKHACAPACAFVYAFVGICMHARLPVQPPWDRTPPPAASSGPPLMSGWERSEWRRGRAASRRRMSMFRPKTRLQARAGGA